MNSFYDFLVPEIQKFKNRLQNISSRETIVRYFDIDPDPDVFLDADLGEMALVGAELVLRSGDKKIRELPEEFEAMAPAWNFEYTPEEIKQAMVAVKKIGQNGSELDFVIEGKGEKIYQEWQKYLSDLHRELETMLG